MRHRGLLDLDRLEAALERGVLLEVLSVLVRRGGTDGLQLATGQHGLEDAGRVDCAFGGPGTDEGMDLIDEQDDVAAGLDLFEDLLQPLLEIAAIAGAGHERTEVERVELLVLDRVRHVVGHDALAETLNDGGLPDARLADENRIVLGTTREDLHDPLDLLLATDDRIELLLSGHGGEVAAELVEHERALGRLTGAAALTDAGGRGRAALLPARAAALVAGQELDDLLADAAEISAELHEHLSRHTLALTDEAKEYVLRADVVVAELQRLAKRELKNFLGAWREGYVP